MVQTNYLCDSPVSFNAHVLHIVVVKMSALWSPVKENTVDLNGSP